MTTFAQMFLKLTVGLALGIPITYPSESLDALKEHGVEVRIVKEIPGYPQSAASYFYKSGHIYVDSDMIGSGRGHIDLLVAHELVHKVRYEHGLWTDNLALEETIAVYATDEVSKFLYNRTYRLDKKISLDNTLKANHLRPVSEEDMKKVKDEVHKTIIVLKQVYRIKE